jgi:hypothetical protein
MTATPSFILTVSAIFAIFAAVFLRIRKKYAQNPAQGGFEK